jgi:hypothetical protein
MGPLLPLECPGQAPLPIFKKVAKASTAVDPLGLFLSALRFSLRVSLSLCLLPRNSVGPKDRQDCMVEALDR